MLLETRSFVPALHAWHCCVVHLSAFYEWRSEVG